MSLKKIFTAFVLSFLYNSHAQDHFPGGVDGAEVWFIADHGNLSSGIFPNISEPYIRLIPCVPNIGQKDLFNFNHSIASSGLCLTYNAPLENATSRNVFFVGEPKQLNANYSHLTTGWRTDMSALILPAWDNRYRFDLANKGAYSAGSHVTFNSNNNANVNFYHWNLYQSDKRFKSYGNEGETSFYIGREFTNSDVAPVFQSQSFIGNFPEFISYPFELTANQKNRVESYLALKYGITLASGTPYRNALNTVFWNPGNYAHFANRIFGIGRDDISGLNQLQSESVHNRNYLIASVQELMASNPEKQEVISIGDNNFIVFGDNGAPDVLQDENEHQVKILSRKWLSQNTDEHAAGINMHFKFNLMAAINQAMSSDPGLKLWMLHDKYVNNQTVSDFTSQYVEYYDPVNMDGLQYGFFENVHFDSDFGIYDQFTFGVGPEMIIQVRFDMGDCDDERIRSTVVITGGEAPYVVKIKNTTGYTATFTINENTFPFEAIAPDIYTVNVADAQGTTAEIDIDVLQQQIAVDLGPDIVFGPGQQQATLNAGANVLDPTATYQWYKDGQLLDYYAPSLLVTEAGEYTVVITSGNRMCKETDTILVGYNFGGSAYAMTQCEDEFGSIILGTAGGVPPFTTVISGNALTVSQVHSTANYTIQNLPPDVYTVTTTDSSGNVFQTDVEIYDMLEGLDVNLEAQIQQYCQTWLYNGTVPGFLCSSTIFLDASVFVTNPNVSYEWFENSQSEGIYVPEVEIYTDGTVTGDVYGFNEYQVVITNLETGCSISETVAIARNFKIRAAEGNNTRVQKPQDDKPGISAKVYPNPADVNATFYYEITSGHEISGSLAVYSPTGAILYETALSGQSSYTIPLSLTTSGTYLAVARIGEKTLTNKIIIK
jgi:hypothetical protein